jgi:hypothetical protein
MRVVGKTRLQRKLGVIAEQTTAAVENAMLFTLGILENG